MKKILYLSYDGMTDPLGQSQVIPYLQGLSKGGFQIKILSFEKKDRFETSSENVRAILRTSAIEWVPLFFTSNPPIISKLYDAMRMKRIALRLHKEENFSFVHCRSYVAADAGLFLQRKAGIPFLFDMRGFWVDERVDSGQWNLQNPFYRLAYGHYKKKEKEYLQSSKHIISLTYKGKDELTRNHGVKEQKISVIPCCVDLDLFNYLSFNDRQVQQMRQRLGFEEQDLIITYLGSLGGWYLTDEMLDFFSVLQKKSPSVKLFFITHEHRDKIVNLATAKGIDINRVVIKAASRKEVPAFLSITTWGIFFIKDAYSKQASSPTKQGELMAMGLPIVCNDIGDTGRIITDTNAGLIVKDFSISSFEQVAKDMLVSRFERSQIRKSAADYFDLTAGVDKYLDVYKQMLV